MVHKIRAWYNRTFRFPQIANQSKVLPEYTLEERAALLAGLKKSPPFQYLCTGLNNYRARFQSDLTRLTADHHFTGSLEDFRKLVRLQEAIYWTGWLESYIDRCTRTASLDRERDTDAA